MGKSKTKGVQYWKKKAWEQFSRFVRVRDAIRTTRGVDNCVCVSCGRVYPAFGLRCLQAGHLIAGRGNGILFEPVGCHGQCYNCNVTLKGNWANYLDKVEAFYTKEALDHLRYWARQVVKFKPFELEELRDIFKAHADEMLDTKTLVKGNQYEDYRSMLVTCRTTGNSMLRVYCDEAV